MIWIFTNVGFDEEYQMCLANRILQGDIPLDHMWEPHQTSVFVCALFMAIYKSIFKTYTGVVIYLQAVGMIMRFLVALALYKTLKKEIDDTISVYAAALFFMISPKDFAIPEYSNLQVWLSTFCFIFLLTYFRNKKIPYLVLAAVMLCLEVITYPSCIIVSIPALFLIGIYSEKKKKIRDILIFSAVCFALGGLTLAFLYFRYGFGHLMSFYQNMLSLEPSHDVSFADKSIYYAKDLAKLLVVIIIAGIISLIPTVVICTIRKDKEDEEKKKIFFGIWLVCSFVVFLIGFLLNILSVRNRCAYTVLFIYLICVGFLLRKDLKKEEKRIFDCAQVLSIAGFAATLMLTNLPFIVSGAYLVLAVALTTLPIVCFAKKIRVNAVKRFIYISGWAFIGLLFLRCIYIRTPMTGRDQICSILNTDMSFVHSGPAKWIITDDEGAKRQQVSYEEFKRFVPEGSQIWITDGLVDDLGYLYADYGVATPSSIPDPKYLEGLNEYWRLHPEKYPDVVICGAYDGELSYDLRANEWFMNWLENDYKPSHYEEGVFYRYYYRE